MQAGNLTTMSKTRTKRNGNRHHTTHPVPGTARAEAIDIRMGVFRQPAMQTPVLVLNASYEPINICGARRALVLVLKGIARTEEEQGSVLHSHRMDLQMPSVIRLLEYRRIPHQTRALSRKNILLRDRNTCQYCQKVLIACELTLDHVVPRSRGGKTSSPAAATATAARARRCCTNSPTCACCASPARSACTPAATSCA
jgi:5-methylcytosine-specific restriction endonuclease McrA